MSENRNLSARRPAVPLLPQHRSHRSTQNVIFASDLIGFDLLVAVRAGVPRVRDKFVEGPAFDVACH